MSLPEYISEIKTFLLDQRIRGSPEAVIILGSGLGSFATQIKNEISLPYRSIPHFPVTSVKGHKGSLIYGELNGQNVLAFSGRFHHYEGFTLELTALPVYLAKAFDAAKLIISNAAGAINTSYSVGDLMVIEDVMRQNMSISSRGQTRFRYNHYPNVTRVRELASSLGITTRQGVYLYVKGPNYETKAEIHAFRIMGADVVGMSTVPELMEASRLQIKTAAISLISNMAAGVQPGKLSHDEVSEAAELRKSDFARLVSSLILHL